jgi:trehalose 6-phosphate phosphatase
MGDLLHWTKHLDNLRSVISVPRSGIISDFDGTLSEFADTAAEAMIIDENARALERLANRVTLVALVSGRGTADLRSRFERPWLQYYGSHGLDRWHDNAVQILPAAQAWRAPLEQLLAEFTPPPDTGVYIENKGLTASVHYRLTADPPMMRARLLEQLQPLCARYGFVLSEGRYIWEIKPPLNLSKGTAVQALVEDHQLDGVVFLGDDVTDLSAMAYLRSLRVEERVTTLSVGVIHHDSEPAGIRELCDITAFGPFDVAKLLLWIAGQLPTAR